MKRIFCFDALKLSIVASLLFLSVGLSAQNYISSNDAVEALSQEMERIANATDVTPGDDLIEAMAKELKSEISDGTSVDQAVTSIFAEYESKRDSWLHATVYLDTAKSRLEELLIE